MTPLPVTVLTGFLGAGKTTLLKQLLAKSHGPRVGVIINELGQAGIDGDARFLELAEGCVCCVHSPDLMAALDELAARGDVDHVILETTGLADPLPLTWMLTRPDLTTARLDAVVTVIDAANQAATQVAEWRAQVTAADVVVLSKLDLAGASAGAARAAVAELNPTARVLDASELPPGLVLELPPREAGGDLRPHAVHSDFRSLTLSGGAYALDPLERLLEELPPRIYRAKGIVRGETGWASFQVVAGRLAMELDAAPPDHGETRIVLFGRGIGDAERAQFERLRLAKELS